MKRVLGSLAIATLLSGCANFWSWYPNGEPPPAPAPAPEPVPERPVGPNEYVVHKGDTLYSIAFRNQLDYREVAKWNGIGAGYLIYPGQVLRLTSPTTQQILSDDGGIVSRPVEIIDPPPARPVPLPPVASTGYASAVWPPSQPAPATAPSGTSAAASVGSPGPSTPTPRSAPIPLPPPPASPPTNVALAPPPDASGAYPPTSNPAPSPGSPDTAPATGSSSPAAPPPTPATTMAMPAPAAPPAEPAAPFTSESGGPYRWQWPTDGVVVRGFNPSAGSKGLDFAGDLGQSVVAAAPGKVVYSGAALKGYGELVIIKHDDLRLSAYGYNRSRLVEEGDMVRGGQKIAELGLGPENKPILHFEIRERGQPVNPAGYLPAKAASR